MNQTVFQSLTSLSSLRPENQQRIAKELHEYSIFTKKITQILVNKFMSNRQKYRFYQWSEIGSDGDLVECFKKLEQAELNDFLEFSFYQSLVDNHIKEPNVIGLESVDSITEYKSKITMCGIIRLSNFISAAKQIRETIQTKKLSVENILHPKLIGIWVANFIEKEKKLL